MKAFFQNFPNTSSLEEITVEHLGPSEKVGHSLHQEFQYLLLSQPDAAALGLEEYRTDARGKPAEFSVSGTQYMTTKGFASELVVFHPAYQHGATFRYLGRQRINGHDTHAVAFAQQPGTATMLESFQVNKVSATAHRLIETTSRDSADQADDRY